MRILLYSYVISITDYCLIVWSVQSCKALDELQEHVNRFIFHFFYTSKSLRKKVRRKKGSFTLESSINNILANCDLLTVREMRDFQLIKFVLSGNEFSHWFEFSDRARNLPLMKNPNFKSKTGERSIHYSAYKMWNKLPKAWKFDEISFLEKLDMVKTFLIENRTLLSISY